MARLASDIKCGFFPTPPEVVKMISSFIMADGPTCRLLDPCSGTGHAINQIAIGLHCDGIKTYGVEIDKERAEQARTVLTKVINGDLFRVRAKAGSFSLLFLNPPYSDTSDEDSRLEHKFLKECTQFLRTDGILIFIIPQKQLIKKTCRFLASWFHKFLVYRFPGKSYDAFGQIVLFATKKQKPLLEEIAQARLQMVLETALKELHIKNEPVYTIPKNRVDEKSFYIHSLDINTDELLIEVEQYGAWKQVKRMMHPPMENVKGKVLMPLRRGHLAVLVACGLSDGVIEKNGKKLLIKGVARKEKIVTVEHNGDEVIEKSTDIIKICIRCIDLQTGEMTNVE